MISQPRIFGQPFSWCDDFTFGCYEKSGNILKIIIILTIRRQQAIIATTFSLVKLEKSILWGAWITSFTILYNQYEQAYILEGKGNVFNSWCYLNILFQTHLHLNCIKNCSTQKGILVIDEFGKYLTSL